MGQQPAALVISEGCRCFPKLHQLFHPLYVLSSHLITGPTILDFVKKRGIEGRARAEAQEAWAGIPALPRVRCVTLGWLSNLSDPPCPNV